MTIKELLEETINNPETNLNQNNSEQEPSIKISTRYNYSDNVPFANVVKDPEEFIIPEELPACKMLWDKGIETYMCGNYDDLEHQGRWIGIEWSKLTEENRKIFDELIKKDHRYSFGHWYKITVPFGEHVKEELCSLIEPFKYQDTMRYLTGEEFLDEYKRKDGKFYYDDAGKLHHDYNPNLLNATLLEALKATGKEELYDPKLNRVYEDKIFMDWHNNYINHIIDEQNYSSHYENNVKSHFKKL